MPVLMQMRPLTPALAEVAQRELNEEPRRCEESLCSLKDWIRKQPHLKARTDDQWLVAFLRGCKWSLERTKEKIDIYYSLRSTAPDLFRPRHSNPKVMDILDIGVGLVLPKTASPVAPRVVLVRPGSFDPDKHSIMEITAVAALQQQICYMEDDNAVVSGIVHILDFEGTNLNHFLSLTPLQMKKIITLNQDAAPSRMKSIHFLNMPLFFEPFFNMAKLFLNEKNKRRFYFYSNNYTDLYKDVPKDILPIEYGGIDYSVQEIIDSWKMKVQHYHGWFEEDLQYGTDESKRLEQSKAGGTMFGVEGSFRRLELD